MIMFAPNKITAFQSLALLLFFRPNVSVFVNNKRRHNSSFLVYCIFFLEVTVEYLASCGDIKFELLKYKSMKNLT